MAQANPTDSDTNDNSDISSQLSEIKESYERRISELHQEFSQLKDLMMAIVNKNSSETQPSSSQGPSKRPQQQFGFDTDPRRMLNMGSQYFLTGQNSDSFCLVRSHSLKRYPHWR